MTAQLYSNNAITTTVGSITNSDTTILVSDATVFNAVASPDYELATLDDGVNVEIVQITNITSNTCLLYTSPSPRD